MNLTSPLTGSHLRTYNSIFQHPLSHNVKWRDVHALLCHLGNVEEERNGNLKVTRGGEHLILHIPRTKDVAEIEELMALRRFLEKSEAVDTVGDQPSPHWLLVIDHHEARIFRTEMQNAVPQKLLPHEPSRYFRHAQNSINQTRGKDKPDPNSFFEPVAKLLEGPGLLVVFGTGTGKSSEMDQFINWLKLHHPAMVERIVGSFVVDEHHLTDRQLLGKAREFYAQRLVSHQ